MLAVYGPAAGLAGLGGRPLDYAAWFGLWLNLPRQRRRRAWEVMEGLQLAHGRQGPPPAYCDAVTSCEEESVELEYRLDKARRIAREMP